MFSGLIVVAQNCEISLESLLSYELSAIPFSLFRPDGTLLKIEKNKLPIELEKGYETLPSVQKEVESSQKTCWLIDGMAVIQMVKTKKSTTFGDMVDYLLSVVLKPLIRGLCSRVDVVFDRYDKIDSIKSFGRARRQVEDGIDVSVAGPNTRLPKQWGKFHEKAENKSRFTTFLCEQ